MLLSFVYSISVFTAGVGVLQAAAAYNDLRGLRFFTKKLLSYLFAVITISIALTVLAIWNWNFTVGIIQGAEQAGLFLLSIFVALLFTAFLASIINNKRFSGEENNLEGLEALRNKTFFQVLEHQFKKRE